MFMSFKLHIDLMLKHINVMGCFSCRRLWQDSVTRRKLIRYHMLVDGLGCVPCLFMPAEWLICIEAHPVYVRSVTMAFWAGDAQRRYIPYSFT